MERELERPTTAIARSWGGPTGLASVLGRVYFNQRLGTCLIVATGAPGTPSYY
jgi:hypothetical protein